MGEFLSFRKMITPLAIQIVFWIAVVIAVIYSLMTMFDGGFASFVIGLIMLVFFPIVIRVYCELVVVMFRIYDELVLIRTGSGGSVDRGFPVVPVGPVATPPSPAAQ